jgi:hypothetical protein
MSDELRERAAELLEEYTTLVLDYAEDPVHGPSAEEMRQKRNEILALLQEQGEPVADLFVYRSHENVEETLCEVRVREEMRVRVLQRTGTFPLYLHPAPERDREAMVNIARLLVNPNLPNGEILVRIQHITDAILNTEPENDGNTD